MYLQIGICSFGYQVQGANIYINFDTINILCENSYAKNIFRMWV